MKKKESISFLLSISGSISSCDFKKKFLEPQTGINLELFFLIISAFVIADSHDDPSVQVSLTEELRSLDESDSSSFGINNKCIRRNAIRSIRFQDDQIAIVKVGRGKEIVLSLTRPCLGIKRNGFIFSSRSNKLCERFDYFEVMETNMICQIDSIQPHIRLESEY